MWVAVPLEDQQPDAQQPVGAFLSHYDRSIAPRQKVWVAVPLDYPQSAGLFLLLSDLWGDFGIED